MSSPNTRVQSIARWLITTLHHESSDRQSIAPSSVPADVSLNPRRLLAQQRSHIVVHLEAPRSTHRNHRLTSKHCLSLRAVYFSSCDATLLTARRVRARVASKYQRNFPASRSADRSDRSYLKELPTLRRTNERPWLHIGRTLGATLFNCDLLLCESLSAVPPISLKHTGRGRPHAQRRRNLLANVSGCLHHRGHRLSSLNR